MPDKNYAGSSGLSAVFGAIKSALNNKVDKEAGKGLSTNDYTNEEKAALAGKQDTLTFDNVPTEGSTNPVKSGGVYDADEEIRKWTTTEAKSVSGNPITITDGSARNAEGMSVTCEPKQNLHGYDHPWAGGAGKNKLPMTVASVKALNVNGTWSGNKYTHVSGMTVDILTDTDDNVIGFDFNGTASEDSINFPIATNVSIPNGSYILNTPTASGKSGMWLSMSNPTKAIILENNTSDTVTVDNGSIGTVYIFFNRNTTLAHYIIRPMIRLSTVSDATFEPYSNECPITGYDECVVDDHGKNILDAVNHVRETASHNITSTANADGSISISGTVDSTWAFITDVVNVDWEPGTYTFSIVTALSHNIYLELTYDDNTTKNLIIGTGDRSATITTAKKLKSYVLIISTLVNGTQYNETYYLQVEKSASATEWKPYVSHTATITFGQTVYGGSVDFKTGKVTVTHGIITLDGDARTNYGFKNYWESSSSFTKYLGRTTFNVGNRRTVNTSTDIVAISDKFNGAPYAYISTVGNISAANDIDDAIYLNFGEASGLDTTAKQLAWLEQNPVHVCYELATPRELTLTPAELELLKGYNYISTNGTTIALDYLPDSLLAEAENYVDAKIPPVPTTDGTYVLNCTVTDGTPAYSWESVT